MSDNNDYMKKALDSHINFIKRAISMEEGRVSKYVDRIHAIIKADDEDGSYNRESISKVELIEAKAGLKESFRRVEDLHWSLSIQQFSRAEDEDYYAEDGPFILPVQNKYCEGIEAIKRYNLASEIGQKEAALIKVKESFENSKKVVQAALDSDDADVKSTASTVEDKSPKNKTESLGESISKETFENSINAQTNKTKTELVEPQSQCLYGSKLMSLMDESSDLNLKCEEENAHDETRSCQMFLKYEIKHEKVISSLKCEGNGIKNDLSSETKSLKYERKEIKHEEDGLNGEGFESDSDEVYIKADKTVDNEKINASASAKEANAKDDNAKDAIANASINEKAPDEDKENQYTEFLKTINLESRKVGIIKLTSHVSLQKMISLVVFTTGCITSYSVNMVRWAGRASLVIMNQEEKDLNTDTNKDGLGVSMENTALGGTKLDKFARLVKATLINLFETHSPSPKFRAFKVMVANLFKLLVKIWSFELEKGLEENKQSKNISMSLLLYEHAVLNVNESESSDVVILSAAILSDFKVNIPRLKGNIKQIVKNEMYYQSSVHVKAEKISRDIVNQNFRTSLLNKYVRLVGCDR